LEITEFPSKTVYDKLGEASVPKTSSICSAIFVQCRLVTKMEWFGVVEGHPKTLKIASLDTVHRGFY